MDTFIDKIFVTPDGDGSMRLDIRIFTGDTTSKYLQKLKRRANSAESVIPDNGADNNNSDVSMGHTFKLKIPNREIRDIFVDQCVKSCLLGVRCLKAFVEFPILH
ncbi:MAG: hypothetical protein LUD43_04140 [Firmicutes bacterium]|nr:hypothetical protein [Bacillota bacterium]